ncbi:hypothetical protein [Hyphomicrobium sp. MC1]|uniref:hypothetical protein n=1 Tax=Hyphomicrobium sp. (strain MC1) TaxID=717785 RepID=UPI000213D3F3|nr:hypothetical protein [Hyphomicrobium sp. MC1]CCB67445.1 protein of unknown function [Hyphomicrobium sp. MC1]
MILTQPRIVSQHEAYRPLLELLNDVLVKPKEIAARYSYTEVHLANLRKNNRGWPFIKLDSGGVRYRLSEIIAAEVQNTAGPLTVDRVCLALAACKELSTEHRAIAQRHIRAAFETVPNPK